MGCQCICVSPFVYIKQKLESPVLFCGSVIEIASAKDYHIQNKQMGFIFGFDIQVDKQTDKCSFFLLSEFPFIPVFQSLHHASSLPSLL